MASYGWAQGMGTPGMGNGRHLRVPEMRGIVKREGRVLGADDTPRQLRHFFRFDVF